MCDICSKLDTVDNYRQETWGQDMSVTKRSLGSTEMMNTEPMVTRPPSGEMCDTYSDVSTSPMRLDTFKTMDSRNMANSTTEQFEKLYKVRKIRCFAKLV